MTRMLEAVEAAIANAPIVSTTPNTTNDFSQYTAKPDDHPIHVNPEDACEPHMVFSEAEKGEFHLIFEAIGAVTGKAVGRQFVEYAVRNENQHWEAAVHLGAKSGRFGVSVFKLEQPGGKEPLLGYQPLFRVRSLRTTKLGVALISGYPSQLSVGDMMDVQAYGYQGLNEIAQKAMKLNGARKDLSEMFYPVPLSSFLGGELSCGGTLQVMYDSAW